MVSTALAAKTSATMDNIPVRDVIREKFQQP